MNKKEIKFNSLAERYFEMFHDSFPTFSVGNNIDIAINEMTKAIESGNEFVPDDPKNVDI